MNGSLWSIRYELIFYIAAVAVCFSRRHSKKWGVVAAIAAVILANSFQSQIAGVMAITLVFGLVSRLRWGTETLFVLYYAFSVFSTLWGNWARMLPIDVIVLLKPVLIPIFSPLWQSSTLAFLGGMLFWNTGRRCVGISESLSLS